nr:hypothetical protein [Tanacetum cinerariifolium]
MHKAFPLPGESSHCQYKFPLPVNVVPTARRLEMPLPGVCTAIAEMMKKLPAFPLPVMSYHYQKKFPLLVRKVPPAEEKRCHCREDCTANEDRG